MLANARPLDCCSCLEVFLRGWLVGWLVGWWAILQKGPIRAMSEETNIGGSITRTACSRHESLGRSFLAGLGSSELWESIRGAGREHRPELLSDWSAQSNTCSVKLFVTRCYKVLALAASPTTTPFYLYPAIWKNCCG